MGSFRAWRTGTVLLGALVALLGGQNEAGQLRLTGGQAVGAQVSPSVEFFVSLEGNDSWSGKLAEPRGNDGPFATIARAQQAVRDLRKTQTVPMRVVLRGGIYYLDQPLEFGSEDSGTEEAPIVYAAAAGERVVLSGGRRLTGGKWGEVKGHKAWVVDIPEVKDGTWRFRQLFVNGERRPRPRLPKEGEYRIAALPDNDPKDDLWEQLVRRFEYSSTDIQPWHNAQDVDVVAIARWVDNRLPIQEVDAEKHLVTFDRTTCRGLVEVDGKTNGVYWVENVLEALDTPGQWYLDRPLGRLYYLPLADEDPSAAEIIAPRLTQVVRVVGTPEAPVKLLRFEGLAFAHTEWQPPRDWAGSAQAAPSVPGAVFFSHAQQCSLSQCHLGPMGTYAVEVGEGCMDVEVSHSQMTDLGAGGVKIERGSSRTTVADNEIGHGGRLFPSAVGILVRHSPGNRLIYNHIYDLYYSGISVGWVWNFGPNEAVGNIVEHNHIHDIGQGMLSDMGGIYTLGVSPGTRLRYNVIHDVQNRFYGGWGIYPDEGSADMLIEKNLVYRCKVGPIFLHINRRNTVENNIFAFGGEVYGGGAYEWRGSSFRRNLAYYDQGQVTGYWNPVDCTFERNLYWNASGKPVTFGGKSFAEWQAAGQDQHSTIADPLFADPEHGDFRLRPGSPAAKIGFEPWDLSDVGPRP